MTDGDSGIFKNLGQAAYGFFTEFLKEKRKLVSNFFVKNKVGFLPLGMDYSLFQNLKKKSSFKQLKFLIGNHSTLPIVMTGFWINSLSEEEQLNVIEDHKDKVYKRYKEAGINILNMCTTGFMESFIKFLTSYNLKKNLSREELVDTYESNLKEWSNLAIFVKKDSTLGYIKQICKSKINARHQFFYMFAKYSAKKMAREVIKNLHEDGFLKESRYEAFREKLNQSASHIVWIFEKQGD